MRAVRTPAPILAAFRQALGEAWAGGAGALLPIGFLTGAAVLAPLGVGTDPVLLRAIGPGMIWVALALASLVTMERIFQSDLEDGALDMWLLEDAPMPAIAGAKTFAHWLASGLPLALISPLIGIMFGLDLAALLLGVIYYALGSLAFFFWGGVSAALSAGIRRGGLLIALIALPLYVPSAIFGAQALRDGAVISAPALLLTASTLFALSAAPFAIAAALRLAAD